MLGITQAQTLVHPGHATWQVRNVANTGCVPWGGKLLATFEAGQVRLGAAFRTPQRHKGQ